MKALLLVLGLLALALALVGLVSSGSSRWKASTEKLVKVMEATRSCHEVMTHEPGETDHLPGPVQRYFQAVLDPGQPVVSAVKVEHTGTFNMSDSGERWMPFTSVQRVVTRRPGFVWDARIRMAPLVHVHVHDAYVAGEGVLRARLLGLLTVMEQPSTPELAHGELLRFLAEAAWYPTALLPSQGVIWTGIDDTHAMATLRDGPNTVELVFEFDQGGLIRSVRSEGRHRELDGALAAVPWEGRFSDYQRRDGMLVPLEGEVAWLLPEGRRSYWRGTIQGIDYEFAR